MGCVGEGVVAATTEAGNVNPPVGEKATVGFSGSADFVIDISVFSASGFFSSSSFVLSDAIGKDGSGVLVKVKPVAFSASLGSEGSEGSKGSESLASTFSREEGGI